MFTILKYTLQQRRVRQGFKGQLFILLAAAVGLGANLLRSPEVVVEGAHAYVFQAMLLIVQLVVLAVTHMVWTKSLREPLVNGRMAAVMLLPVSRTQVALGTFMGGLILGFASWFAMVAVALLIPVVYAWVTSTALVPLGFALRIVWGQSLALLTLLCLQFALAAELSYKASWRLLGHLVPMAFVALALVSQLFSPLRWLRFFTPVTLTAGEGILTEFPTVTRTVVQLLLALYLVFRARKRFARRNIRPVLDETTA